MHNDDFLEYVGPKIKGITESMHDAIALQLPDHIKNAGRADRISANLEFGTRLLVKSFIEETPLPDEGIQYFHDLGNSYGQSALAISDLEWIFQISFMVGMSELFVTADAKNYKALKDFSTYCAAEHTRIVQAAIGACEKARARLGGRGEVREVLVKQLLEGGPVTAAAEA
ncbi:hypothetical protein ACFY2N_35195, partial [Streptomyces rubiginosohelvolus]|uniref:hypothetical protein n=1 Tax=Streptomyces rubiginosohelvolus TaxID=67362 RepID=UPI00369FDEA1